MVSHSRTSLDRNRWQLNRVIFTACLPSLIHCSAMPRLLYLEHTLDPLEKRILHRIPFVILYIGTYLLLIVDATGQCCL